MKSDGNTAKQALKQLASQGHGESDFYIAPWRVGNLPAMSIANSHAENIYFRRRNPQRRAREINE